MRRLPTHSRRAMSRETVVVVLVLLASACHRTDRGSTVEGAAARGEILYSTGLLAGGRPLTALIVGGIPVSGTQHPCVQCHETDGRGGGEAGAPVPDVRWERLSAPYGISGPQGNWHRPYDVATLARSLRDGVSSAGEPFGSAMPRYLLEDAEVADLSAYLEIIGTGQPTGATASTIRVASLLPLSGPLAPQGHALRDIVLREIEAVNAQGGIHGRRIDAVLRDCGTTLGDAMAAAKDVVLGPDPVFCFLASGGVGASREVRAFLSEREIPLVGPLAFTEAGVEHGTSFFVLPCLEDQARSAASYLAARRLRGNAPIALVGPTTSAGRCMTAAFADQAHREGLVLVSGDLGATPPATLVTRLRASGAEALVVFADGDETKVILEEIRRQEWRPELVQSLVLLGPTMTPRSGRRIVVAPPVAPSFGSPETLEFDLLVRTGEARSSALVSSDRAMHMAAFAASKVLVEALKRAGRDLERTRFQSTLESLRHLTTGVTPPLTFGPNRRHGTRGALMASIDDNGALSSADWFEVKGS